MASSRRMAASSIFSSAPVPLRPGDHLHQGLEAAHLPHPAVLVQHVLQGEGLRGELVLQRHGLAHLHGLLGLLDQAHHVAHAQDARGDPLGVERLQAVQLLARPDEADGLPRDALDRQRRAAAGVGIELAEDDPRQGHPRVELLRDVHRVLAGHGIRDQQRLVGLCRVTDAHQLGHQLVVHLETARRVDDDHVVLLLARERESVLDHAHGVLRFLPVDGHARLLPEHGELLDRRGADEVSSHQEGRRPWSRSICASLAAVVVFPEPCSPSRRMTVCVSGPFSASPWCSPPSRPTIRS